MEQLLHQDLKHHLSLGNSPIIGYICGFPKFSWPTTHLTRSRPPFDGSNALFLNCTLHSTLYTPHSALSHSMLHPLHCTIYTLYTLYIAQCIHTLYTLHCTICTLCTLHTQHSTLDIVHSTQTLRFILCTLRFTHHSSHFTLHALHSTLCIVHSALYSSHSASLGTLHITLHTPRFATLCTSLSSTFHSVYSAKVW